MCLERHQNDLFRSVPNASVLHRAETALTCACVMAATAKGDHQRVRLSRPALRIRFWNARCCRGLHPPSSRSLCGTTAKVHVHVIEKKEKKRKQIRGKIAPLFHHRLRAEHVLLCPFTQDFVAWSRDASPDTVARCPNRIDQSVAIGCTNTS